MMTSDPDMPARPLLAEFHTADAGAPEGYRELPDARNGCLPVGSAQRLSIMTLASFSPTPVSSR